MSQQPDIKAYSLQEFFSSGYKVPTYQRNFAWGETQVNQLLDDLLEFNASRDPYYLLGDTIVADTKDKHYKYELIDGQQRTTTLQILLAAIWVQFKKWGLDEDATNDLYTSTRISKDLLKVKASGSASSTILDYMRVQSIERLTSESPSQKNAIVALDCIEQRLAIEFPEAAKKRLVDFKSRLLSDCYLGRLTLPSVNQAAEIFEKTNNRGIRLNSSDLLKNRLFQKISSQTVFDEASSVWTSAEKTLMDFGKLGTMEFLIRQMRQAELGEKITERQLFEKTKSVVNDEAGCLTLITKVKSQSQALAHILSQKTPSGNDDPHASTTKFFGFTQGIGVKLAAYELEDKPYLDLSRRMEARIALSLLANERPQTFEKLVPTWAKNIRALGATPTKAEIIAATPMDSKTMGELWSVVEALFRQLTYGNSPGSLKRLRYVLAVVNVHLSQQGGQHSTFKLADYLATSKSINKQQSSTPGFDIDHISARTSDRLENPNKLGNLTLLYYKDNQFKSDGPPKAASAIYGHSHAYATRALTQGLSQPPEIEKIISGIRVAVIDDQTSWDGSKVQLREDLYWNLFRAHVSQALDLI